MATTIQVQHKDFPSLSGQRCGTAAEAVVLIHGFPECSGLWRELAPLLTDDYTVVMPDLPGTAGSALPDRALSMEELARSVQVFLDDQGIGKAVIAGHSMGGYTALAFAALFPERVLGLSLIHSSAKADTEEKKEQRRKAIALIQKGGREAFVRQMIPGLFSSDIKERQPELIRVQTERALAMSAESLVKFYEAMIIRPDRTGMLAHAAFPLQWILGREDALIDWKAALTQVSLTNTAFVSVYEHTGHMSMLEHPRQLAADLKHFVQYCYNR